MATLRGYQSVPTSPKRPFEQVKVVVPNVANLEPFDPLIKISVKVAPTESKKRLNEDLFSYREIPI